MKYFIQSTLVLALCFFSDSILAQVQNNVLLDGLNDYIYIGDVNDLGTSDFTLEAWIYVDNFDYPDGGKIVSKGLTSVATPSNAGYGFRVGYTGATQFDFAIHGNGGNYHTLTYDGLQTNQWYHIACVRENDIMKLFINCELIDTLSIPVGLNVNTDMPLTIGALDKAGLSFDAHFFEGNIDEVRIWTVARSSREICDWRNCSIDYPMPNLLAVYNMNHTSGTTVTDNSGNNNDGTLMNGGVWKNSTVATQDCHLNVDKIDSEKQSVQLYPNPTTSSIQINGIGKETSYSIVDLRGKIVKNGRCSTNESINISELNKGVYVINLRNDALNKQLKFIKD